jgi:hypothetical protein
MSKIFQQLYVVGIFTKGKYYSLQVCAERAGEQGNSKILFDLLSEDYDYNLDGIAEKIAKSGSSEFLSKFLQSKGDYSWDYNKLAKIASEYGNIDIFDSLFKMDPNYEWNFNDIAIASASNNELDFFKHLVRLAPADYMWLNVTLENITATYGYEEFLRYLGLIFVPDVWDYVKLINIARNNGHDRMVEAILVTTAEIAIKINNKNLLTEIMRLLPVPDYNRLAVEAVANNNAAMYEEIINLAPGNYQWNNNLLMTYAVNVGNESILFELLHKIQLIYSQKIIDHLVEGGHIELADKVRFYFAKMAAFLGKDIVLFNLIDQLPEEKVDYNLLAAKALQNNQNKIYEELVKYAPENYKWDYDYLRYIAAYNNNIEALEKVFLKGDTVNLNSTVIGAVDGNNIELANVLVNVIAKYMIEGIFIGYDITEFLTKWKHLNPNYEQLINIATDKNNFELAKSIAEIRDSEI